VNLGNLVDVANEIGQRVTRSVRSDLGTIADIPGYAVVIEFSADVNLDPIDDEIALCRLSIDVVAKAGSQRQEK
jgi:hypothetical protein